MSTGSPRDAVVSQPPHGGRELGLVGRHRAPLAGRDDLPRVERQAPQEPERPAGRPAVAGPERPGRILDESDLLGDRGLKLLPRDGPPEEVHREHRSRPRRDRRGDVVGAGEERLRVDVHEHGAAATELDGVRRGRERVRGHDHLVARPDPEREHREVERRRPRRDRDRVRRPDRLGDRTLERGDLRAHRQLAGRQHVGDRRELGFAQVRPREADGALGHAGAPSRARYHAIVRSRPSSSSTRASNPSSARAFSTFGIRSSTSM